MCVLYTLRFEHLMLPFMLFLCPLTRAQHTNAHTHVTFDIVSITTTTFSFHWIRNVPESERMASRIISSADCAAVCMYGAGRGHEFGSTSLKNVKIILIVFSSTLWLLLLLIRPRTLRQSECCASTSLWSPVDTILFLCFIWSTVDSGIH